MSDDDDEWWKPAGAGLLLVGLALLLFWEFSNLEARGGAVRVNWIIARLYEVFGKWITCSILGFLGAGLLFKGLKQLKDEF